MKKINILFIFIFSVPSATFAQQSDLLEKYRSMAVEYNTFLQVSNWKKPPKRIYVPSYRVTPTFNIPVILSGSL